MKISLSVGYSDAMTAIKNFRDAGFRAEISTGGIYVEIDNTKEGAAKAVGLLLYSGISESQFQIEESGMTYLQRQILG